jgi:hypothetical protein
MGIQVEVEGIDDIDCSASSIEAGFLNYEPDLEHIKEAAEEHGKENLIVIGEENLIAGFRAIFHAFLPEIDVDVSIVTMPDPDHLHRLSTKFKAENTVVMPFMGSETYAPTVESLLFFLKRDYDIFTVCSDQENLLKSISEEKDIPSIENSSSLGRFAGGSEAALAPAAFAGLDVSRIREGIKKSYNNMSSGDNAALHFASALQSADGKGRSQILNLIYSTRLLGFQPFIASLFHRVSGENSSHIQGGSALKKRYAEMAHEEDVLPLLLGTESFEKRTLKADDSIRDLNLRDYDLKDLDGFDISESLKAEYHGMKDALNHDNIPHISLNVTDHGYRSVGELVGFIQCSAAYLADMRDADTSGFSTEKLRQRSLDRRFLE